MRLAIYARVSSSDGSQDTENQISALRQFCAAGGDTIVAEYIDHASAKNGDRAQFKQLLADSTRRKFDGVLVWALDRFSREGIEETFGYLRQLKTEGVDFISYSEPQFRTTGPLGELLLSLAAWMAKQERNRISERTKAGLARVKAAGKILGPPRVDIDTAQLQRLRNEGLSARTIAERMGLRKSRVHQELQALGLAGKPPVQKSEPAVQGVDAPVETRDRVRPRRLVAECALPVSAGPVRETPKVIPFPVALPKIDSWQ